MPQKSIETVLQKRRLKFERNWRMFDRDSQLVDRHDELMLYTIKLIVLLNGGALVAAPSFATLTHSESLYSVDILISLFGYCLGLASAGWAAKHHSDTLLYRRAAWRSMLDEEYGYVEPKPGIIMSKDRPESKEADRSAGKSSAASGFGLSCFIAASLVFMVHAYTGAKKPVGGVEVPTATSELTTED